ncbi:MAG: hypothetical protein PVH80_03320 [Anaerolineae bacterium]|jgi:hypothetical protein
MKRVAAVAVMTVALSILLTGTALASNGEEGGAMTGEIAVALAPLAASALAVERMLEMAFARVEGFILNAAKAFNVGSEYVAWAKRVAGEYEETVKSVHEDLRKAQAFTRKKLKEFTEAAADERQEAIESKRRELVEAQKTESTLQAAFDGAEDALEDAEQRLKDFVSSPYWTSRKRALTVVGGIILGLVVAVAGQLGMFSMLNIDLTPGSDEGTLVDFLRWADIVITGLFIGTGSKFVHQVIGILQEAKDTITDAGNLWRATAHLRLPTVGQELLEVAMVDGEPVVRPRGAAVRGAPPIEPLTEPIGAARSGRRARRVLR